MSRSVRILSNTIPTLLMIGLIPLVANDSLLLILDIVIIVAAFLVHREKHDGTVFLFGLIALTASEALFISTGVETFLRHSLFDIMPVWLPFLWAYAFVAIKRSVRILGS